MSINQPKPDTMTPEDLAHLFANRPYRYFDSLPSTMLEAQRWLAEDAPDGGIVLAAEQTQGKGRLGRDWMTPLHAAIALSIIFREQASQHAGQITMLGAVAVAETLESLTEITLKWPNDVHIKGKKVAGILAESVWGAEGLQAIVLGIGINVAVDFSASELASRATSLSDHLDSPPNQPDIIETLLARIDHWRLAHRTYQTSQYGGLAPSPLFLAWKNRLTTLGQTITLSNREKAVRGIARDVDHDGALLVEVHGEIQRFMAGDVTLSPPSSLSND